MRASFCVGIAVAALIPHSNSFSQILSSKRGFADVGAGYANLQATNAGWYYTWGTGASNPGGFDANHYPMIWGGTPSQATLNNIIARNPAYVLGFNEPERSDQANMTVSQAISSWTTISNALSGTSIKLVSPAVADTGGATGGQAWLADFVSQARANNLKLDAIAFHWYGVSNPNDPAGAASSFLSRVQSYWNTYQLPVFITEFAIHDWGGAYTDAQIAEANRQFLNIVIPQLESRGYVAGYAWYHWFGDSRLYNGSGNVLTPTPLSYSYIGAVGAGSTSNISGQSFGEHVAPLTGGQITVTGAAPTLKFINALDGESIVSGSADWGLAGNNGWVRIQPGARLIKAGPNTITFASGSITNNGVLEVAQGTLRLGSGVIGNGSIVVRSGTLNLSGAATLALVPTIEVRTGGVINASSLSTSALSITSGRTLNSSGRIVGSVIGNNGATIAGAGTFAGNYNGLSGSTLRIGTDALGVARRYQIDNFESYANGDVVNVAGSNWTAHQGTTFADIETIGSNKVLSVGTTSGFNGVSRRLPAAAVLDDNSIGTYFFRFNAAADNLNHNFGIGDRASTETVDFGDFEAQLRLKQGTSGGTFAIDARNGNNFTATLAAGLTLNTWYNVWMVINQATDRYDLYMNTGASDATAANKLNASQLAFRNGTNQYLDTFLALAGGVPVGNAVRIDDLVFQIGFDLTNPLNAFDPGYTWTAQSLKVTGNYTQNAGARAQFNLSGGGQHDALSVDGVAALAGTLELSLVNGYAPQYGDSFDIITAASVSGGFNQVLGAGLSPEMAIAILVESDRVRAVVAMPGDADLDGDVDGIDVGVWAQNFTGELGATGTANWLAGDWDQDGDIDGVDVGLWAGNFTGELGGGLASVVITLDSIHSPQAEILRGLGVTVVPEPGHLMLLAGGAASLRRRRREVTGG